MDERLDSEERKSPPQSPRSEQTVIVFDWDDTLLASSFLSGRGYKLDTVMEKNPDLEGQLKDLETSVKAVLTLALTYGDVIVITNAETGWVELSAQKFIPGVVPLLSQIRVLSARSTYEPMFPDAPLKWKFYAFQERLSNYFLDSRRQKNIISFGDSHVEREAVRTVTKGVPNTRTKSVKFAERPSMEQLRRQIELVTNCFQYIHNHQGDLDLQLTVTINNSNTNNNNNNNNTTTTKDSTSEAEKEKHMKANRESMTKHHNNNSKKHTTTHTLTGSSVSSLV
jgi:hypothetical protein